jgi:alpha-galactosidase
MRQHRAVVMSHILRAFRQLRRSVERKCFPVCFLAPLFLACDKTEAGPAALLPCPSAWIDGVLDFPYSNVPATNLALQLVRQDFEELERNLSVIKTPLTIGSRRFQHGLGTHAVSHLVVLSPEPLQRFSAWIGVDNNERTEGRRGSVVFRVTTDKPLFVSPVLRGGQEAQAIAVDLRGARQFNLLVDDAGDGPGWDHADWAEATVRLESGKDVRLGDLPVGAVPWRGSDYPFSFTYAGKASDECLPKWSIKDGTSPSREGEPRTNWMEWSDGGTANVRMTTRRFRDFPAVEWLLHLKNTGTDDTAIFEHVQALDITLDHPIGAEQPFRLHRSKGAPADPTDFEPATVVLRKNETVTLGGGGGRSSNRDFPFFKVETGHGSLIVAVGWSGQWQARLHSPDGRHLRITAGLEKTRFKLHPGEEVRSPRLLLLFQEGDTLEANAQFRQLIHRHYAARLRGQDPLPTLFCNTCFTRGGGWLNECNASNQISLIKAYAPLGLEALLTDAGWFEGGWPAGAGNWTPRKEAYPQGMGPVAAEAQKHGMIYGLWFEPERVVAGTGLHRQHPEWVLTDGARNQTTFLANFGLPEVRDYFFNIVRGFMALPGFRVYRQDFNMDPLAYWRHNDAPDRQGLTEIRYVEGLYEYWDRIATEWPDSLREECASGGRRMDLETVMRLHLHQKSDYWFDNEADQASVWSLSQYLPNHVFATPLIRLDDYSFHSTLPASLCLGWIADAPDFDLPRAQKLVERYRELRPLLVGAWYPLLPYSRDPKAWIASQFHRPDLQKGLVLIFRRGESPYRVAEVRLHGLESAARYELLFESTGEKQTLSGELLMKQLPLAIPEKQRSELMTYRRLTP